MGRRIITTENLEEDVKIESHLRPQLLEDYIGQAKEVMQKPVLLRIWYLLTKWQMDVSSVGLILQ